MSPAWLWHPGPQVSEFLAVVALSVTVITAGACGVSRVFSHRAALRHCILAVSLGWMLAVPALAAAFLFRGITWTARELTLVARLSSAGQVVESPLQGLPEGSRSETSMETLTDREARPADVATGTTLRLTAEHAGMGSVTRDAPRGSVVAARPPRVPAWRAMAGVGVAIWMAGSVVLLIGWARNCVALVRLRRTLRAVTDSRTERILLQAQRSLAIRCVPRLAMSSAVPGQ